MKKQSLSLWIAAALLLCLAPATLLAAGPGAKPLSARFETLSDQAVDHHFLGFVDVDGLMFEDSLAADAAGSTGSAAPFRVAEALPVRLTFANDGTRETLPDGGTLWRLRVSSPGAIFLSFNLRDVALPPGAEMRFYSVERAYQDGPYTAAINNADRVFTSPAIPGDSAMIEVYLPASVPFQPTLSVASISHGYRDFNRFARVPFRNGLRPSLESATGALGACEVDVNCSSGSAWQADKRAVARTYDGRYLCTGALINNARQDCKNYFLTANHCVSRSQTASGMVFYWNYENSTCGGNNASAGQTTTGSTLRATNSSSDFTLLELTSTPPAAFNVYYGGFNRAATAPSSGVAIHHPTGAAKKISFENNALQDGGGFSGGWGGTHWRVTGWDVGTTEGGSSGCPLFNSSHQIVGQLHGGTADCSGGWDEFGKLASSWGGGLSSWLDPDATGLTSIGGKESSTCGGGGGPTCLAAGNACTSNSQCCSGSCAKKTKTCN
jgi:hypothetical protein